MSCSPNTQRCRAMSRGMGQIEPSASIVRSHVTTGSVLSASEHDVEQDRAHQHMTNVRVQSFEVDMCQQVVREKLVHNFGHVSRGSVVSASVRVIQ